jgi:hypothetical protein
LKIPSEVFSESSLAIGETLFDLSFPVAIGFQRRLGLEYGG